MPSTCQRGETEMRFLGRRLSAVVCVAAAVGMAGAAIAYATVPSSDGTITGCYSVNGAKERGGTELNVVDAQATSCAPRTDIGLLEPTRAPRNTRHERHQYGAAIG